MVRKFGSRRVSRISRGRNCVKPFQKEPRLRNVKAQGSFG